MFDIFMLFAQKAGVLLVQAVGNHGPEHYTTVSFSPWAIGVASCDTDRSYPSSLILGNGQNIPGIGLSGNLVKISRLTVTHCHYLMSYDISRVISPPTPEV